MSDIILHSGYFVDRSDRNIKVVFFRRPSRPKDNTVYVSKKKMVYDKSGGFADVDVWSYGSQAQLIIYNGGVWPNNFPNDKQPSLHLMYQKKLEDSDYYRYTYRVSVPFNDDVNGYCSCALVAFNDSTNTELIYIWQLENQDDWVWFNVSKDEMEFNEWGSFGDFDVSIDDELSYIKPVVSTEQSWISITKLKTKDFTTSYRVSVGDNNGEDRNGVITIDAGSLGTKTIVVKQKGESGAGSGEGSGDGGDSTIVTNYEVLNFGYNGTPITLRVQPENAVVTKASYLVDWVTLTKKSNGEWQVSVSQSLAQRSTFLTITAGDETKTITINQNGGLGGNTGGQDNPSTPVDPPVEPETPVDPEIDVDKKSFSLAGYGQWFTFTVTSTHPDFSVSTYDNWLYPIKQMTSTNGGKTKTYQCYCDSHLDSEDGPRSGKITVVINNVDVDEYPSAKKVINITQA